MAADIINRALNKAGRVFTDLSFAGGLLKPWGREGKRIIMYHGIDLFGSKKFNLRFLSTQDFEKQIKYFSKYFNVLSLEDYFQQKFKKNTVNIAITFDDGMLNNFKYAIPILEKYKVPATFFVTGLNDAGVDIMWADYLSIAAVLGGKNFALDDEVFVKKGKLWVSEKSNKSIPQIIKEKGSYDFKIQVISAVKKITPDFTCDAKYFDYWKLMSDADIMTASKSSLVSIGSHGYYHNNLGNIPLHDAILELKKSKEYLENLSQKPCDSLGYPDGSYTRSLIEEAFNIGFKYQLAAAGYHYPEDKSDERIEDRYGVYPASSSPNIIKDIFNKLYEL